MTKLNRATEIHRLAASLNVDWQQNAVQNIIALCHRKISSWLDEQPAIGTVQGLEALVCGKLRLVFEEVRSEEDLNLIIRKYVNLGEPIFATLKQDLDEKTFATLIERRKVDGNSKDRYVAVIDCRGAKGARRFFTRWHEIAHLLTLEGQLELPLHRSTTDHSPTERLMDSIAAEIGFYDPLFLPILSRELTVEGAFTFEMVERIREKFCPQASFQATLNACVSRYGNPLILAEFGLGLKKGEEKRLHSRRMNVSRGSSPKAKLRAVAVVANPPARPINLVIHRNMEVPATSLIHRFFRNYDDFLSNEITGSENLSIWKHSDGRSLANINVQIRARRLGDTITALIYLA